MAVTRKTIDDVRWYGDDEIAETDSFLAVVVREYPREDKMDEVDIKREVISLGHGYESVDEVAETLLNRLRSDSLRIDFDPAWARLIRTDGVVEFGSDEYDPNDVF